MDLACLPASLHNRPEQIPSRVAARIRRARADGYDRIFIAYADCGTGGLLDRMLETEPAAVDVTRLEGAHCYEVYAGRAAFAQLHDDEPGTFYLTDYLARNFDRLVVRGLGLDRHPELLPMYFGNYRRLVYLAQTEDANLTARAEAAAARLGELAFERRYVGLGELAPSIAAFAASAPSPAERPAFTAADIDSATGRIEKFEARSERPAFQTKDPRPESRARGREIRRSARPAFQPRGKQERTDRLAGDAVAEAVR